MADIFIVVRSFHLFGNPYSVELCVHQTVNIIPFVVNYIIKIVNLNKPFTLWTLNIDDEHRQQLTRSHNNYNSLETWADAFLSSISIDGGPIARFFYTNKANLSRTVVRITMTAKNSIAGLCVYWLDEINYIISVGFVFSFFTIMSHFGLRSFWYPTRW